MQVRKQHNKLLTAHLIREECTSLRTPACIRQSRLFLTFRHAQVSIVCHRRLCTAYSASLVRGYSRSLPIHPLIPGDELHHQLPTETHIASPPALLPLTDSSTSGCSGNLRFRRQPSCDEQLHSVFVVSPSSKNNQLAGCVGSSVYFQAGFQSVATWQRRFSILSRRCSAVSGNATCSCNRFSSAPNRPSKPKVKNKKEAVHPKESSLCLFSVIRELFACPTARRWRGATLGALERLQRSGGQPRMAQTP